MIQRRVVQQRIGPKCVSLLQSPHHLRRALFTFAFLAAFGQSANLKSGCLVCISNAPLVIKRGQKARSDSMLIVKMNMRENGIRRQKNTPILTGQGEASGVGRRILQFRPNSEPLANICRRLNSYYPHTIPDFAVLKFGQKLAHSRLYRHRFLQVISVLVYIL